MCMEAVIIALCPLWCHNSLVLLIFYRNFTRLLKVKVKVNEKVMHSATVSVSKMSIYDDGSPAFLFLF